MILMEDEDRISLLPDCLLIEILSLLPSTKEAIKTGTLSKRWQHLWPQVHNLIFLNDVWLDSICCFVNKTLTQCSPQSNLNKFQLCIPFFHDIKSQVNYWICYATNRNVQELDLSFPYDCREEGCSSQFEFDQFFYMNSCFTQLKLGRNCLLKRTGAISWNKLKRLYMYGVELDEDVIQNILSGSPLLETLELRSCYGFSRIDITSNSVKNLVFFYYFGYGFGDSMEISAPHIQSLTIKDSLWLCKFVLHDVSSLVKAKLDYKIEGWSYVKRDKEAEEEEMLKGLISSLRHVKELIIGKRCLKTLSRLEAKGFILPLNLKVVDYNSLEPSDSDSDSDSDRDLNESGDSDGDSEELVLDDGSESEGGEVD